MSNLDWFPAPLAHTQTNLFPHKVKMLNVKAKPILRDKLEIRKQYSKSKMCLVFPDQSLATDSFCSVAYPDPNPDPDPSDPYVFGPPGTGSGSISQRYGSASFSHQAKIVRKILILTAS
jgi:hypothetical protein